MARMLGNAVLPDLPYAPKQHRFPEVSLAKDTLPAHNAASTGLSPLAPRPSPTIVNLPSFLIPESPGIPLEQIVGGAGYGQGVVPHSPRPAPAMVNAPRITIPAGIGESDYNLGSYELTGQNITPESQYTRPSHTLEIYGAHREPSVAHLDRLRPETYLGSTITHGVTEVFGGDPIFEAERNSIRPTNPRLLTKNAPKVNIVAEQRRIPIRSLPIVPAPTQARIPNISKMIGPVTPIKMEAQYIAPPIRNADLGGLLNSTSLVGGIGNSSGRAFGAEAHLIMPF